MIYLKSRKFTIYNKSGEVVKSGVSNESIDVSNLTQGLYLLKTDNSTGKFIIE